MNNLKVLTRFALILFCFMSLGAHAMGGLSKVMFSEVQGVVVKDGKPVGGVKVTREFKWAHNDDTQKDSVTTDASGKFRFPSVSRFSIMTSLLPHEPVIKQKIVLDYEGKEYLVWRFFKRDYDENGELGGKSIKLECDVKREEGFHINKDILGICTLTN